VIATTTLGAALPAATRRRSRLDRLHHQHQRPIAAAARGRQPIAQHPGPIDRLQHLFERRVWAGLGRVREDPLAAVAKPSQEPLHVLAARPRLASEMQLLPIPRQLAAQRRTVSGVFAIVP
jgi:hypothetical protein